MKGWDDFDEFDDYKEIEKVDGKTESKADSKEARAYRKKKRIRTVKYAFTLFGCLIVLVGVMYAGMMIYTHMTENQPTSGVAVPKVGDSANVIEGEVSQKEDENWHAKLQSAVAEATDKKEQELLDGIRNYLDQGLTVVETFRRIYKDEIVIVSGGKYHFIPISDTLKHNTYQSEGLRIQSNGELQYLENGQVITHKGIDVSKHQGNIDWKKVAASGVEFAILRVGYRGYGETGKLMVDEFFDANAAAANAAGVKIGVYMYSQAITEAEAVEEAQLVLDKIAPYKIDCPVVFDVEKTGAADGRMNQISVEERTAITKKFCDTIAAAGYKPMIYHNMEMSTLLLNLEELEAYEKWFAYYNQDLYYPYEYSMWQYSDKGRVDGIKGDVDLNISFGPAWE